MSNSTKVIEENLENRNFGFESALFIPPREKFANIQQEKFEDFNDLFIYKSNFESSNNLESNEAQKRNPLGKLNVHSLISEDLMKKIEDCSPLKSSEAQKFGFIELKIPPKVLFTKPEAQTFNSNEDQNLNFFEEVLQQKISKENFEKLNSNFMQNPFFVKAAEGTNNPNLANLINETEQINFDKFDSIEFQNYNNIHKEENKNLNEELLFSKLLESLNINNESNLDQRATMISDLEGDDGLNSYINDTTKKQSDLNSNFNCDNNLEKKIFGDSNKNGQLSATLLQNININNNFNYNICNSLPYLYYYNYLMSLNPYLLNASLFFKLNYLQKFHNYLIDSNKNNKSKSSNYQFGKAGWTCLYCNNFNYEIRIKCNRCGKLPQNRKDSKPNQEVIQTNTDKTSYISKKSNPLIEEKKGFESENLSSKTTIKNNIFGNIRSSDIQSNVNSKTNAFVPSSFKDSNIYNNTSRTINQTGSDTNFLRHPTYPDFNENQKSSNVVNDYNYCNPYSTQNNIQIKSEKMNKFNVNTDWLKDDSLQNKHNRNVFGYNSNSKMIELNNNNISSCDSNKFYSNGFMKNQFLYNQNTPINKFNSCNNTFSNPLINAENDSSNLNGRKNSVMELQRPNQKDINQFNFSKDSASQLTKRPNMATNPIDLQSDKKKKRPFVERVGDWVCLKCKNLNFSFRLACNRCHLTKVENQKLIEGTGRNLL